MSFTTVEEVAMYQNKDVASLTTMQLAQITSMIPYIDGVINNYVGWNMLATDYTDKRFNGNGTNTLDLRLHPVNSITMIRERLADLTFTDITAQVEILEDGLIQFLPTAGSIFTAGVKNYFISFNAGFDTAELPSELTYAANYLISINYGKVSNNTIGIQQQKNTDVDIQFNSIELPALVQRVLDRYRLISIF